MPTETHTQTYTCPKCGKIHAADLSAMEKHPELHGKVHCMKCHTLLWLSMGQDGRARCELYEAHLHEAAATKTDGGTAEGRPAASSPATAGAHGGSGFLPVLVAALVAAGVSFFVARATGQGADPTANTTVEADTTELEQRLEELESRLGAATRDARQSTEALQAAVVDLQGAVQRNAESLQAAPPDFSDRIAALQARIEKLAGDYKSLNGRIEGNYNAIHIIKKRLESPGGN